MWFRRSSPRKIALRRGDTLGGSTSLLMIDQVKPARGGRRFRRKRSSRFIEQRSAGGLIMPLLLVFAIGVAIWAAWGLVDWGDLGGYFDGIRARFTGE